MAVWSAQAYRITELRIISVLQKMNMQCAIMYWWFDEEQKAWFLFGCEGYCSAGNSINTHGMHHACWIANSNIRKQWYPCYMKTHCSHPQSRIFCLVMIWLWCHMKWIFIIHAWSNRWIHTIFELRQFTESVVPIITWCRMSSIGCQRMPLPLLLSLK